MVGNSQTDAWVAQQCHWRCAVICWCCGIFGTIYCGLQVSLKLFMKRFFAEARGTIYNFFVIDKS